MTKDTWAIIGTMTMIGAIIVSLEAIGINQLGTRIDDVRTDVNRQLDDLNGDVENLRTDVREEIASLRTDVRGMGERLRYVEIEFGKVDQRLLTLERAIIPAAEQTPIDN